MRADRLLAFVAALLFASAGARDAVDGWIEATDLPPLAIETSVEVLDSDGGLLRAYTVADGRWRLATRPGAIDPRYLRMLISYEDKRFHRHIGVDPLAVLRAAGQAIGSGRVVSGASTLTMQTARLLEDGPTGSWAGKLRQLRVALALERRLTKQEILAIYLQRAPFGGNIEGVRAASLAWFGKPPRRLADAEAALLVALPQSPETRRPDRHPNAALAARNRVVTHAARAGLLADDAAEAAYRAPLPLTRRPMPAHAPHLANRLVAADPARGTIRTTIDGAVQRRVEALAQSTLQGRDPTLSIAIVVADHATGAILAHVGAAAYEDARRGYIDMTRALRSPGSTLKPLIFGLAFDAGLGHPETMIADRPVDFGGWQPQNFDGRFRGDVRLADALRQSLNLPTVKLTEALGPARLMAGLERAAVRAVVPGGRAGLAVALGGVGVTLEDLVALHAGIARGGTAVALRASPGGVREGARILGPEAAWHVGNVLRSLAPPPGAPARALAWKTGTSYGHRDAWAIGWDGAHVAGVWIGRPDGTPVPGAFGADRAAPVLFDVFGRLKPGFDPLPPPPPGTLLSTTATLPPPLRRFGAGAETRTAAPRIAFPPDGARLSAPEGLAVKIHDGLPPFTLLADGAPVAVGLGRREVWLDLPGPGFVTLSLIDAAGNGASSTVRLD